MAKRISELDVATSVSDSDYIPCVQGGVTKRATRAALYPDDVPVDTSSRILDLTGDRCPAIPDDPAGVTYLQDAWATTVGWAGANATLSVGSGNLVASYTSGGSFNVSRSMTISAKLVTLRIRLNRAGVPMNIVGGGTIYKTFTAGTEWQYVSAYISGSHGSVVVNVTTAITGDTLEIDWVYIGTGAYLSKLVDRAGVPWTNYGALPVDGPFGKGLQFPGNSYLLAPGPMIGTTGTVACRFKRGTLAPTQILCGNYSSSVITGFNVIFESDNSIRVRVYSAGSNEYTHTIATISDTNDHDLAVEFTGSAIVSVLDGVKTQTTATVEIGTGLFTVGRNPASTANYFTGTIYAFRADSRVWTDEEIARWSRDPYSEDSGLVDAFSLDFTNLPTFADNAAAIAGNLPAGKLYKTSTGNVLVRY